MKLRVLVTGATILAASEVAVSFAPLDTASPTSSISVSPLSVGNELPYGPPSAPEGGQGVPEPSQQYESDEDAGEDGTLKGNRFSKFAPDAALETPAFREQLKENMKADLERRRREDPNRGNQPAKTYLDNL